MAAMCDIRKTTISDLPPEVLSHIFSYLPNNIRVIRLVCSQWNESCNTEKVSGREKIVIGIAHAEEFFSSRTLLRNIYNLHLEKVAFQPDHVKFFEKFGVKLRLLELYRCGFDGYVPFLKFCVNLNTLVLLSTPSEIVKSFRRPDGSFFQSNIVSLRINFCLGWSDETLDGCFRICPHLRSLTLELISLYNLRSPQRGEDEFYSFKDGEERVFNSSGILSFSCIHHAISVRAAHVVELNFGATKRLPPEQIELIASLPDLKLKKLQLITGEIITLPQKSISNIVDLQPDLQSISIGFCQQISPNGWADLIERCSKLICLEIDAFYDKEFALNGKLLDALSSRAHLCELKLSTRQPPFISSDFESSQRTFDHLRTLELSIRLIDHSYCFLNKVSVRLKHLTLIVDGASSQIFEFLSNRFTCLESFKLQISHNAFETDFWGKPEQIASWKFEVLKELRIEVCEEKFFKKRCTTNLFTRLKAPNLRHLEADHFEAIDADALSNMMENYPLLECLKLSDTVFNVNPSNLRILSGWKRLNFLYHDGIEYLKLHQRRENEEKFNVPRTSLLFRC